MAAQEDGDVVREMRVYDTPYAYTPNGAPLYIEYGGEQAARAATAARALQRSPSPPRKRNRLSDESDPPPPKKARLVWTEPLHAAFVRAVHALGVDSAVPKQIMSLMGVRSLTRENVASHLQKYRAAVRRAARDRAVTHNSTRAAHRLPLHDLPITLPPPEHARILSPVTVAPPLAIPAPSHEQLRLPSIDWKITENATLAPLAHNH